MSDTEVDHVVEEAVREVNIKMEVSTELVLAIEIKQLILLVAFILRVQNRHIT